MNNEIDLLDELDREERDERLAESGGGAGAALGVVLTLVIGCGLVFAAYKLGQRKNVDEPPLIAAAEGPIKIAPENPGGSEIPNTDNLANAMIEGTRPELDDDARQDGVTVEAALPAREIDPAATVEAREIRREIVDLGDLAMKPTLEGEPQLEEDGPADRSDERLLVSGAEVSPNARPTEDVIAARGETETVDLAAAEAQGEGLGEAGDTPSLAAAGAPITETTLGVEAGEVDTQIAAGDIDRPVVETADAFGGGTSVPIPLKKPNVGPSVTRRVADAGGAQTPALAPVTRTPEERVRRPLDPAVASRINPTPPRPQQGQQLIQPIPQVPSAPGVRQARIPPQPIGDAQVQLGAFPTPNEVRARWSQLRSRHSDILGQLGLQVLPVQTNSGQQLFRMRVGPLRDGRMAGQLCEALRVRGVDCFVPAR